MRKFQVNEWILWVIYVTYLKEGIISETEREIWRSGSLMQQWNESMKQNLLKYLDSTQRYNSSVEITTENISLNKYLKNLEKISLTPEEFI